MSNINRSEIARLREQIELEERAIQLALTGYALTSPHEMINARMERGGEYILHLIEQGKHEEAQALMNTENWGANEPGCVDGQANQESGEKQ